MKLHLVFLAACFLFLSFSGSVNAQSNAGITLIPATIEERADPGTTQNHTLKITNVSDVDKEYFVYKRDITGVEAGGVPLFADEGTERTGYELTDWLVLPSEPLKVAANATVELPITINVPAEASPGSHFGGVFVSAEPPKLRETGAGVGYEVVSVISIRINGDVIDAARIRSFSTDKLLYGAKNVQFTAKIENQGNILIRPRGPVSITSMFNSDPVVFSVNENQYGVFPGTMRDLNFEWNDEGLGFGRYEAVLALAYDGEDGQKTIDASLVFWVFPMKVMLGFLVGLIIIVVGGYAFTKYYINQAIMRAAGGRRIVPQRYRKQVGVSRFAFVFTAIMAAVVLFLLVLLIFSA
ncbi:hypothetical protein IPH92_01700 [Candidatus Kaiserbacteria bacterium]|nr:MAG: hypothetical protein IPH92_01700 [Candidatus Kaiserbacteria bacterium]